MCSNQVWKIHIQWQTNGCIHYRRNEIWLPRLPYYFAKLVCFDRVPDTNPTHNSNLLGGYRNNECARPLCHVCVSDVNTCVDRTFVPSFGCCVGIDTMYGLYLCIYSCVNWDCKCTYIVTSLSLSLYTYIYICIVHTC